MPGDALMKTSKKQFNEFKYWFMYYQKLLNLNNWKIYFKHEALGDNCFAAIDYNSEDKTATASLNLNIGKEHFKEVCPQNHAKHEALELLLADLNVMAESRFISNNEIKITSHSIIRTLEKVIK